MIRQAEQKDAKQLAALILQVERESPYMLYEAEERKLTAEKQTQMIGTLEKQSNSVILLSEMESKLTGYLFALGGQTLKNKHNAYIVIGILSEKRGQGIGTALFNHLERWALKIGLHRLELTVLTDNIAGIKLYQKTGFEIEGVKRDSLFTQGKFADEYVMSKILEG